MNEDQLSTADDAAQADDDAAAIWAEMDEIEASGGTITLDLDDAQAGDAGDVDEASTEIDATIVDGTVVVDGAADTPRPDADASSVWDTAPEALRTEFEKLKADNAALLQKERSSTGRATSFQRRYEELAKAAQPRAPAGGDRPSSEAAIEALREDYPEIAEPLSQALNAIKGDVETLTAAEQSRQTAAQAELNEYLDEETTALKSQHPDYVEVLEKNAPKFVAWIDDQPRAIRDAFARNAAEVTNAAEAATVIGLFKAHIGLPAPAPAAETPSVRTPDPLASRRSRQLAGTASLTRANRRPTVSGIPENGDPQAIWDAFDAAENG